MILQASHRFGAPPDAVREAMGDVDFYTNLRLPDLEPPEVVDRRDAGARVSVRVRFTYSGTLDPIARRVVGGDHISWIQELLLDRGSPECALRVVPDGGAVPVACGGRFVLAPEGPNGCVRRLSGELKVRVPLIGGRAERSLAPGITRRLDLEAAALDQFLQG